jgi:CDP-4-dehydro-6-deoxyglucose reductase
LPEGDQFACPADQPILNAAHAADILISYSCRSGQCGSCLGQVIAGDTSYPDGIPLATSESEARAGRVLFCSAYAVSDLVIELFKPEL